MYMVNNNRFKGLSKLVIQGKKIFFERCAPDAHERFIEWIDTISGWLDEEFPDSALSATWCTLNESGLSADQSGFYDDHDSWVSHINAVRERLAWLSQLTLPDDLELDVKGLGQFATQGKELIEISNKRSVDEMTAHERFYCWVEGVADWLDRVAYDSGLSADWYSLDVSTFMTGNSVCGDVGLWTSYKQAIKKRLEWLQKIAIIKQPRQQLSELALPYEIPLNKLSDKEFERLCLWIVTLSNVKGHFENVEWLNEDGGGERGRDILAREIQTGRNYAFQCKRVKQYLPSNIRKELTTFADYIAQDPSLKPDVYVLFVSCAITDKTKGEGDKIASQIGMSIEYWTKSTIDLLIRKTDDILERFAVLVNNSSD